MNLYFLEALDIREHPIKKTKKKIKPKYFTALSYIINKVVSKTNCHQEETKKYISERLNLYRTELFADIEIPNVSDAINEKACINCLSSLVTKPWRKNYRFMLVCDAALVLLEKNLIVYAAEIIKEFLSNKRQLEIEQIISLLYSSGDIGKKYICVSPLIKQYRLNNEFFSQDERSIIVTANISAGKSTLINALVGKPIARTSQEICTGNVCYLFNKAFEDGKIYLATEELKINATNEELHSYDWGGHISIASYFVAITSHTPRMCIIDTPGVDAALYKEHGRRTRNALLNDNYDIIIYVICPTRLGTDAEKKHMQWVAQNLQKDKVIFVLNKLDDYRDYADSIDESINGLKKDLLEIGFENPVICPISAYFAYLLKLRMTGQHLSEDEKDEYDFYSKKFKRSSYDLSRYYKDVKCLPDDSEEIVLSKRVGLYGLEKIIYGGQI